MHPKYSIYRFPATYLAYSLVPDSRSRQRSLVDDIRPVLTLNRCKPQHFSIRVSNLLVSSVLNAWEKKHRIWKHCGSLCASVVTETILELHYWAIPLIKNIPIDELAICVPRDRKCAFYTVRQTLVYGNMRKYAENYGKVTEVYKRIRKLGESP